MREDTRQLSSRVEIDDAYLGGELSGGKAGRGSENKVPFIAAVQTTEDGQPVRACFVQCPFTKEAVQKFAAESLMLSGCTSKAVRGVRGAGLERRLTGPTPNFSADEYPLNR